VVEVLHFMGGEDSPRRVLCPWRAHRLASTLPAVARATAVCFLRCECLISARDTVHSSRVTPYIIYMCWSPTYYRRAVPSCPLRVRCNNSIDTMFSPNLAPSTAGSGYTRARTPQGGMSPTALSALFPTATTSEGLTATEVASQT
jgi:hypothetical protein